MLIPGKIIILTQEDRMGYYRDLQDLYFEGRSAFLCISLYFLFTRPKKHAHYSLQETIDLFPEFLSLKPEDKTIGQPWFPVNDKESRMKILKQLND